MSNSIQLAILFVIGVVLIGVVLPFLLRDPKSGAAEATPATEGEHHPFTILGYSPLFLGLLLGVEIVLWWYTKNWPHPEWTRFVLLGGYVVQLIVWEHVTTWWAHRRHQGVHVPHGYSGSDTAENIFFAFLLFLALPAVFAIPKSLEKGPVDWAVMYHRIVQAGFVWLWTIYASNFKRLWDDKGPIGLILIWAPFGLAVPYLCYGYDNALWANLPRHLPSWWFWLFPRL